MSAIIELKNISKHFADVIAVDQVDLVVNDREFLTLLGPSGCGKSTLLRMIGGFESPTTGTIELAGEDVTFYPPQKRDVNMMFQDYALFPHMSVGENIAYGLQMKGIKASVATTRVKDVLDLVDLYDKIDSHPHQLSGGQKQRIALARAVVREPKVLLLDEPLSALDAKLREQMQVELKHMHDQLGITFIMVTHDQTEALVMSDRVVVMEDGSIAQDGPPEDLYERPVTPYVANFIGTTNFLPAKLTSQNDNNTIVEIAGQKLSIANAPKIYNGSAIQVGVRPEKARVLLSGEKYHKNFLKAEVKETIYFGLGLRSVAILADDSEFLIDILLPECMKHLTLPKPGEEIRIAIEPHNILLFEADV